MNDLTVFVPVYNVESTIRQTLLSIIDQTVGGFNIIVIDNCSTDNTVTIVREFSSENLTLIVNERNIGAEANFNKCAMMSKSEFTAILHGDDIYYSDFLERQLEKLKGSSDCGVAFSAANIVFNNGKNFQSTIPARFKNEKYKVRFRQLFFEILRNGNFIICPSAVFRTSVLKSLDGWNAKCFNSSADLDLWLRTSMVSKVVFNESSLLDYNISESQGSHFVRTSVQRSDFIKLIRFYVIKYFQDDKAAKNLYSVLRSNEYFRRSINSYISDNKSLSQKLSNAALRTTTLANMVGMKNICYTIAKLTWFISLSCVPDCWLRRISKCIKKHFY